MKLKAAIITLFTIFTSSIMLADTIDILYNTDTPIAGFQFDVDGVDVTGVSGGAAEAEGFMLTSSATTVIGFSLTGDAIAAGEGVLVVLEVTGTVEDACLSGVIISDAAGEALDATVVDCLTITSMAPVPGCTDDSACNYNADATEDDGSCTYAEENYDCDGNCTAVVDCADECNGTAMVDCAGECNGTAIEDCTGECGGVLVDDACGECGGDNSSCTETINILYNTDTPIAGFQFNVDGVDVTGVSGGAAEAEGFMLSSSATTVIGFSLTGDAIDPGAGVLVVLEVIGETTAACLTDVIISDGDGAALDSMVEDCLTITSTAPIPGCMEMDACNYNANATEDDGSCTYAEENYDCDGNCTAVVDCAGECNGTAMEDCAGVCEGTAAEDMCGVCDLDPTNDCVQDCAGTWGGDLVNDECGVCDGDGIPVDECDCDGNVLDECDVCGGDGVGECWDGSFECDELDCPGGTVDVLYNTDAQIAGFQFVVEGVDLTAVSGGASGDADFMVSTGNNTVVGFSLSGDWIDAGEGVLIVLDVIGDPTAACLSDVIISDGAGVALDNMVVDCLSIFSTMPIPGCMDVDACNYEADATVDDGSCSELDCAGECDGSAMVDECGVCNGDNATCSDCAGVPNGDSWVSDCGCVESGNSGDDCDDCSGMPNGDAVEDECGVCDGDGIADGECDCDGNVLDECGVCGGDGAVECWDGTSQCDVLDCPSFTLEVLYNTDAPIAGFQFDVDGVTVVGVSGGDAEEAGFMLSASETTVLGFSLAGTTIPVGEGVLVILEVIGNEADACISGLIISDSDAGIIESTVEEDCLTITCGGGFFLWDGDACTMPDNSIHLRDDGAVLYNTYTPIGGFQFNVDDATIVSATGGASEDAGFMISASESMVLGFSLTGATIDGCGTLVELELDGEATGLSGIIISDASGIELPFTYFDQDVASLGCMDMDACNYNADATLDDGSCLENDCAGECGGDSVLSGCDNLCNSTAEVDECGVCDSDATNDCVQDCADVWGGDAVVDDCGVCDSDATNDNTTCVQDCAEVWGGDAVVDDCGVCDSDATNDNTTCVQDCAEVWGGDAVADCAGDCGGTAALDDCTTPVCSGGTTELVANASCTDCNSEINGTALVDMCEVCDSDATNDCVQDCAEVWGGDAVADCAGDCGGDSWESDCGCVAVDNSGDDCDDYCGEPNGDNSTCSSYPSELTVEGWSAVSLNQYDETCSGEATASIPGPFDLSGNSCESLSITFTDDGTFSGSCALPVPVPVPGTWVVYNSDMLCLTVGTDEECATYSYSATDGSFGLSGLGDDGNCWETVFQLTSSLAIDEYGIPAEFTVYQNYPNPFNPSTAFEFNVATPTNVSLLIYDLTGKEVYSLASGYHVPGRYSVVWNAIDYNGQSVSSGMYIYQLRTSDAVVTKKLVLLR